jgi:hypothetical protein
MPLDYRDAIPELEKEPIDAPRAGVEWLLWVSDGGPKTIEELDALQYGNPQAKYRLALQAPPAPNMYGATRMSIISGCVGFATSASAQCYVLTTGYGPVDPLKHRPAYNVPGEMAINEREYKDVYLSRITALLEAMRPPRFVVYYAPVTKEKFRDPVFDIICSVPDTAAVMYGATRHRTTWHHYPLRMIKCLKEHDQNTLDDLQREWHRHNPNTYPFSTTCMDGG